MTRGDYGELSATARARGTTPQALWQRRQVAAGRCARCGKRRGHGTRYCDPCMAADAAWRAEWLAARKAQGLCRCGRDLEGHTSRCPACLAREARAKRAKGKTRRPR